MKKNKCSVDVNNETLIIKGHEKQMAIEGFLGCFRITAAKTVSIPPRSEVIIPGKVCVPIGSHIPSGESIVEPVDHIVGKQCALTARSVVSPGETVPV